MPDSQALWSFSAPILAALPRVGAAIAVTPLFARAVFPTLLRTTIALSLAIHVYPYMRVAGPGATPMLLWMELIGKEVFIGALLGLAAGALIWAFESVGTAIDFQVGFSNAQIFDPFGGHETGPVGLLMTRLGVVLFVVGGGLQTLSLLLFESFRLWPPASFYPSTTHLEHLAGDSLRSLTEVVARLAAPVVLLLALIDLGFGLLGRAVPQLNVFYFTMPIKGALAALMLALYLSYLSDVAAGQITELQHWLQRAAPALVR